MSSHEKFPVIPNCAGLPTRALEQKRRYEKITFFAMACLYCSGNGHEGRTACAGDRRLPSALQTAVDGYAKAHPNWRRAALCPSCMELVTRVEGRTERCPHMAYKSYCHLCPRPCHPPAEMARITPLMRYSGPRLLLRHPVLTLRHVRGVMRSKKIIQRYKEREHV